MRSHRLVAVTSLVVFLSGLTGVASPAFASGYDDQRRDAERRAAGADQRAASARDSVEGLSFEIGQAVLALEATRSRLPAAQTELDIARQVFEGSQRESALITSRLDDARSQQASIARVIAADEARGERIRAAVGQVARRAYKGQSGATSLSVVKGATSTEDFINQYGLVTTALCTQTKTLDALRQVEATNRKSKARLSAVENKVTVLQIEADKKVAEAEAARQAAAARETEIGSLIADQSAQQQTLVQMKGRAEAEQAAAEAQSSAIAAELAGIIAQQRAAAEAARAAAAAAAAVAGKKAPPPLQRPSGTISGALFGNPTATNPISVTSEYGMRLQPVLGIWRLHAGIDLRARCETPIYAGRVGAVLSTRVLGGDGNRITIDHGFIDGNSVMTAYNHLSGYAVVPGQVVVQGQLIGYAGDTGGVSTGCHLDFQVYVNAATVNPRAYLGL
ncbi:MAG: peptidoglycan DD-metalloendopeptidase family protein [Phycicoccus sp.]|nr:peptidoglycan DD-metalloendopeptidase family protein [Phycicoccus sp.]